MKILTDAEIHVETHFSIESGDNGGNRFRLDDYGSLSEFFTDCACWFSDEENPEYVYVAWDNIPDSLINENWICPNIFEIRDALQSVDDGSLGTFFAWCKTYGWDIATDDPYKMVSDFLYFLSSNPAYDNNTLESGEPDSGDDSYRTHMMLPADYSYGIFDDNYN